MGMKGNDLEALTHACGRERETEREERLRRKGRWADLE